MSRFADLVRDLFHRPAPRRTDHNRFRPTLEPVEDRITPTPTVTIQAIADGEEGISDAVSQLTRTGPTDSELTVMLSLSGTATPDEDYVGQEAPTVTFEVGQSTVNFEIEALTDSTYDPDETVVVEIIGDGIEYQIGSPSSATVEIMDNPETVTTLIHDESFQLTGDGTADVQMSVVYNAEGYEGLYLWTYVVTNTSSTEWTSFSIPVEGMDDDAGNLGSDNGWTGTEGEDEISWSGTPPLGPSEMATFTFTTAPREIGPGTILVSNGTDVAELPTAPAPRQLAPRPLVKIEFGTGMQDYKIKLNMTVANGNAYTTGVVQITETTAENARNLLYLFLINNDWVVEKDVDKLLILGRKEPDGTVTGVTSLTYQFTDVEAGQGYALPPGIHAVGQVQVGPMP